MATKEEAVDFLAGCVRHELRDHAFGDVEVCWTKDGVEVASGYYGTTASVSIPSLNISFKDDEARYVRRCGEEGHFERNDSTGPAEFSEGTIMPGLTKEAVFEELTTPPIEQNFFH